jgi:hypothetical protein
VAKKLIKTGAIRAIKSSIEKEKIKEEKINSGFKRSQVYLILDRLAWLLAVLLIRIRRIRMVLGLLHPDPDPVVPVRGTDPDPSIIKQI